MNWLPIIINLAFLLLIIILLLWYRLFLLKNRLSEIEGQNEERGRLLAQLATFIDHEYGFYYMHDFAGKFGFISEGVHDLLGLNPKMVLGQNIKTLISGNTPGGWEQYNETIYKSPRSEGKLVLVRGDGSELMCLYTAWRFESDSADSNILGIIQADITAERSALKNSFTDAATFQHSDVHQLKNQLSAILGFSEILSNDSPDADEAALCLQELTSAARRSLDMLEGEIHSSQVSHNNHLTRPEENASEQEIEERNCGEILFVDDEKALLRMYGKFIERAGFSLNAFSEPAVALRFFQRNHGSIKLVLMDWMMPEIDGPQFLNEILKINSQKPIIVLSGKPVRSAGVYKTLEKPVNPDLLETTIREALQKNN